MSDRLKRKRHYFEVPWHRRWTGRPGSGKRVKRSYHKAARQALRQVQSGRNPRGSLSHWSSECNWKSH